MQGALFSSVEVTQYFYYLWSIRSPHIGKAHRKFSFPLARNYLLLSACPHSTKLSDAYGIACGTMPGAGDKIVCRKWRSGRPGHFSWTGSWHPSSPIVDFLTIVKLPDGTSKKVIYTIAIKVCSYPVLNKSLVVFFILKSRDSCLKSLLRLWLWATRLPKIALYIATIVLFRLS